MVAAARFCPSCGTPVVAGAVAREVPAWQRRYLDEYFRGRMASAREEWNYENGLLRGPAGVAFKWLGNALRRESDSSGTGHGHYDGTVLAWRFADMEQPFYEYRISPDEHRLEWIRSALGPQWSFEVRQEGRQLAATGGEALEGSDDVFEVGGDVPLPVSLFVAMYTKAQLLHAKWVERNRRTLVRCNKLVLTAGVAAPRLCSVCAAAVGDAGCMCCGKAGDAKHDANLCKSCAPKKGLCGRCSDPLKGSQVAGRLCGPCGLGSRGMNCAKLTF